MKLRDRIRLTADLEDVWRWVGRFEDWPLFIEKIQRLESLGADRYRAHFRMKSGERCFELEIVDRAPLESITVEAVDRERRLALSYELRERGGEVIVTETQTIPIPWFVAPLVWFLHRFGKPVGPTNLQCLAQLVLSARAQTPTRPTPLDAVAVD